MDNLSRMQKRLEMLSKFYDSPTQRLMRQLSPGQIAAEQLAKFVPNYHNPWEDIMHSIKTPFISENMIVDYQSKAVALFSSFEIPYSKVNEIISSFDLPSNRAIEMMTNLQETITARQILIPNQAMELIQNHLSNIYQHSA